MSLTIKKEGFDLANGINVYTLENHKLTIKVTNLGCRILEIFVPDKAGHKKDVLLGLNDLRDYKNDPAYFGAVLGRVASRIKDAKFTLNGKEYSLAANNGGNHLHGGIEGFDKKIFQVQDLENGLRFRYTSNDGEEGYPGKLNLQVDYILEAEKLIIIYEADCNQDTIANFTNHMYFNLSEDSDYVGNHLLKINSDRILCVDKSCMVTGDSLKVEKTVFDFREEKPVKEALDSDHKQIENAKGLDHPFVINNENDARIFSREEIADADIPYQIQLKDSDSGRMLSIYTTAPAVQVYTGNYLADGCVGKLGSKYNNWSGIALETEAFPNAINSDDKDTVIIRKGRIFKSQSIYSFDIVK